MSWNNIIPASALVVTLKQKLAEKFAKKMDLSVFEREKSLPGEKAKWADLLAREAYIAGFNHAKALYVDYSKRILPKFEHRTLTSAELAEVQDDFENQIGEKW